MEKLTELFLRLSRRAFCDIAGDAYYGPSELLGPPSYLCLFVSSVRSSRLSIAAHCSRI